MPVILDIRYEIKSSSEKALSFVIYKTETAASAYTQQIFYNLDLASGKDLTLSDVLGSDYKQIADKAVKDTIDQRMAEDPAISASRSASSTRFIKWTVCAPLLFLSMTR